MSNDVELPVRQAAVIYLKNMVLENHKNHCNQNIKIRKIITIKTIAIKTIIITTAITTIVTIAIITVIIFMSSPTLITKSVVRAYSF